MLGYAVGRRTISFFAVGGGSKVAILRIMANTSRLSPSESVVLYFLISAKKRISSCESSPRAFCVSRSRGVSVPGKKSASEMSMASAILASVSRDGTVCPFSTRDRSEEHTSELQSQSNLVCRLLLEKKKNTQHRDIAYCSL